MNPLYHSPQPLSEASGIYRITCITTERVYIGSAINFHERWRRHYNALQSNTHHNQYLQRAWNKYGEEAFIFEVLEYVLPTFLMDREQYWLNKLQPFPPKGFNIAKEAGSSLGIKRTDETKRKVGESKHGKPAHNRGKKHTPEALAKIREGCKKRPPPSQETRKKMHFRMLGNKNSLGIHPSEETRRKLSEAGMGRVMSPEAIEKSCVARRKWYVVTDPNDNEYAIHGLNKFCKEHELSLGAMINVAKGKRSSHKGWKVRYVDKTP